MSLPVISTVRLPYPQSAIGHANAPDRKARMVEALLTIAKKNRGKVQIWEEKHNGCHFQAEVHKHCVLQNIAYDEDKCGCLHISLRKEH